MQLTIRIALKPRLAIGIPIKHLLSLGQGYSDLRRGQFLLQSDTDISILIWYALESSYSEVWIEIDFFRIPGLGIRQLTLRVQYCGR